MKIYVILSLFFNSLVVAQTFEYLSSIGKFNEASSFYISANGYLYITDTGDDELILMDTLGNEIKSAGGYGWDDNLFDEPVDVFADPLSVYVADKNNHSIKRFDKNLNFISLLNKKESSYPEEQFGYPLSCATSNLGDLYFLDSENKRVMKFDVFGNFITSFGGIDAGKYQLKEPKQLAISSSNNIYIIDGSEIIIYDHFGNGINKIETSLHLSSIRIVFDQLLVTARDQVYLSSLNSPDTKMTSIRLTGYETGNIRSAVLFNSRLYVLTSTSILIFAKIN